LHFNPRPPKALSTLFHTATLRREQHDLLFQLAQFSARGVFYVFPYYVTATKLHQNVPDLIKDTRVLGLDGMPTATVFGAATTKTIRCEAGLARSTLTTRWVVFETSHRRTAFLQRSLRHGKT
jgi:hypothetical protein